MKFLKFLGWLFIPYIMIFFQWRKIKLAARIFGTAWAIIALLSVFGANSQPKSATSEQTVAPAAIEHTTTKEAEVKKNESAAQATEAKVAPPSHSTPIPSTPAAASVAQNGKAYDVQMDFPEDKYPETAAHIRNAIAKGESPVCTIDRAGAEENREESLSGIPTKEGYDRDEWPMAMCAEGGTGADIAYITPSDNRGAGSWVGNKLEDLKDGTRVLFVIDGGKNVSVKQATTSSSVTSKPSTATSSTPVTKKVTQSPAPVPTTEVFYKNCTAVRAAGAAPLHVWDPGYSRKLDRDGDGVACE